MSTRHGLLADIEFGRIVKPINAFLLFIVTGVFLFPLLILVNTAFKSKGAIFGNPLSLPSKLHFSNFIEAWNVGQFGGYMLNSIIVVLTSLVLILALASLAAYGLVTFDLPAKQLLFVFILAGFMVPPQVLLVPLFAFMDALNLLNTYVSLILVYVAFAMPFSIFLLRQFFNNVPEEYGDAARMDGCSELQVFTRIYLPQAVPALASVAIYQFVFLWNEFLYAITFITSDSKRTLPAGLMAFQGENAANWPGLLAGIIIAVTPTVLFFLLFQRQFIRGVTRGATKG